MKVKDRHATMIRIPREPIDLYKILRDLQTDGKIKSIQQAAIDGLWRFVEDIENREAKDGL